MNCPNCDTDNREGSKFCNECGNPLPLQCHSCGMKNRPGSKFCNECGASFSGQTPTVSPDQPTQPIVEPAQPVQEHSSPIEPHTPAAERRQLTVMFCDLVGSTSLSGALDPEDLREVIRDYQSTCTEVIQRYDGYVAQLLGDGLLVYFGYPQAHEDDAQRAIRSGFGIVEAISVLNTQLEQAQGIKLAVRLGIHTGLVVIGEMGGEGRQEQLALGETPNIAARIQGLAEPNTVVISDMTHRLIQGYFECEALGEQMLRGVADPIVFYQVQRESGVQSRLDVASTRGLTPLVGREQEVGLLLDRWTQVKDGMGQVILLSGEAGIGKSRLVQVLKNHVADEPHTRWELRSSPYYQNSALYPLIDLIQRTLQWHQDDTPEQRLKKLEQELGQYRLPLEETVPLFSPLLSLSVPDDRYPPLNFSPQRQRQKTLETILATILELSERQPVLFILEDLHWTDPTTLELLELLIEQTPTVPLYILTTCRPEFQPSWSHRSYLTEITVNRLSRNQIEQIAIQVAGGKALPTEIVQQLVDKTDGVPLYVEEMTKSMLESGHLKETNDHYELTGTFAPLAIPATLQDSLMARLDRLMTAKGIAQLGAVIGRQFSYAVLHAVSQLDEATLQRELGRLVEAELVYQRGLPPQATYLFKHALVVDTAYASLLKNTRQQYHQQIAQTLEERFPETAETQFALLAHHYSEAGLFDQATHYWYKAGQREAAVSANREAVACFEEALLVLKQLPKSREQIEWELALQFALRETLFPLREFDRALACLQEAETLAETQDDHHSLGRILCYQGLHLWLVDHDHAQAIRVCQRAVQIATTHQDVALLALARDNLGRSHVSLGAYAHAMDIYEQNIDLLVGDLHYERFGMALFLSVSARCFYSECCAEVGLFAEGQRRIEEAIRIAEAKDHPHSLIRAHHVTGSLALRQGRISRAIEAFERALMICREADIPLLLPQPMSYLGAAYALTGRLREALDLQEQTVAQQNAGMTMMSVLLGETYLLSNRLEEARDCAKRALTFARAHNERAYQAWGLRLYGTVMHQDDAAEMRQAEALYQEALQLAEELGMRPLQAHCQRGLGILYHQTGQVEQARTELSTAIKMYREMEMTFWLPETEAALAEVEGR